MTIVKNYKEYQNKCNGTIYFVEKYCHKEEKKFLWRYGQITSKGFAFILSDGLYSRPNLKKLGLI